jgi:hypothetical protein
MGVFSAPGGATRQHASPRAGAGDARRSATHGGATSSSSAASASSPKTRTSPAQRQTSSAPASSAAPPPHAARSPSASPRGAGDQGVDAAIGARPSATA